MKRGDAAATAHCPGEPPSVAALVEAHGSYVQAVVRRMGVAAADVPDVSQEVWLVVLRRLHSFEGRSAIRSWLYGVCRCVCHDHFRRAHRRHERVRGTVEEQPVDAPQLRQLEARQRLALVRQASEELSPDRIDLLDAVASGTASVEMLALRHRCADKTVFSRLYAARAHLRRALRRAGYAVVFGLPRPQRAAARRLPALSSSAGGVLGATFAALCLAVLCLPSAPDSPAPTLTGDAHAASLRRLVGYTRLAMAAGEPERPRTVHVSQSPCADAAAPDVEPATSSVEFTVFDVVVPEAELRLRQVAFMEFVPYYH